MRTCFTGLILLGLLVHSRAFAQQYAGYSSQAFTKLSEVKVPPALAPTQAYMRYKVAADDSVSEKSKGNKLKKETGFASRLVFPTGIISTQWGVGLVADGDFSKAISDNSVRPRTGQVGFEAVHTARVWELVNPRKMHYDRVDGVLAQARDRQAMIDSLKQLNEYNKAVEKRQIALDAAKVLFEKGLDINGVSRADIEKNTSLFAALPIAKKEELRLQKANYDKALAQREELTPMLLPPRNCPKIILNFLISLGNLDDTLKGHWDKTNPARPEVTPRGLFGSSLLVPGSAAGIGKSVSANIVWKPFNNQPRHLSTWWLHGYFNYSNTRWAVDKMSEQLNILSVSLGAQYTVFQTQADRKTDGTRDGNDVQFSIGLDAAVRDISGEIARNYELRNQILGTNRRSFGGIEPVALLTINSFRVSFSVPYFSDRDYVAGFTGGYPVVGFGFANVLHAASSEGSRPRAWQRHRLLGKWR